MACLIWDVRSGSGDNSRFGLQGEVFIGLSLLSKRKNIARDTGMKRSLFQSMDCLGDVIYLKYSPVTFESEEDWVMAFCFLVSLKKNHYWQALEAQEMISSVKWLLCLDLAQKGEPALCHRRISLQGLTIMRLSAKLPMFWNLYWSIDALQCCVSFCCE